MVMCVWGSVFGFFFVFKQKTAYEMRMSDWSSDVCSSDLGCRGPCFGGDAALGGQDAAGGAGQADIIGQFGHVHAVQDEGAAVLAGQQPVLAVAFEGEIGRASCRERVCQYV